MHVVAKSAKKGRCDAEDAADEIRRENGEKTTQLYLNSSFFILHSSFIIMRCLRILIVFWASTLVDEICQIAPKDKAIAKAKLIPLVYLLRHGSATSAAFASLRPFGISCITYTDLSLALMPSAKRGE